MEKLSIFNNDDFLSELKERVSVPDKYLINNKIEFSDFANFYIVLKEIVLANDKPLLDEIFKHFDVNEFDKNYNNNYYPNFFHMYDRHDKEGLFKVFNCFVEYGFDVKNNLDGNGGNAFHHILRLCYNMPSDELFDFMLKFDEDLFYVINKSGKTPLDEIYDTIKETQNVKNAFSLRLKTQKEKNQLKKILLKDDEKLSKLKRL